MNVCNVSQLALEGCHFLPISAAGEMFTETQIRHSTSQQPGPWRAGGQVGQHEGLFILQVCVALGIVFKKDCFRRSGGQTTWLSNRGIVWQAFSNSCPDLPCAPLCATTPQPDRGVSRSSIRQDIFGFQFIAFKTGQTTCRTGRDGAKWADREGRVGARQDAGGFPLRRDIGHFCI